uniref:WD40 repeat domain-containing protein n=1 Tax=Desertifilum tharense IPPAS B-1220 TaxID=1781255 RepID=A0ACD5H1Q0_9CYAN
MKNRKIIHLWDTATAQEQILPGHRTNITSLIFSPDSQAIASTSWDDTFKLWNIATGREIRTFKGHQSDVTHVIFSPDGQTITSASTDRTVRIWRVLDFEALMALSCNWIELYLSSYPEKRPLCEGYLPPTLEDRPLEARRNRIGIRF